MSTSFEARFSASKLFSLQDFAPRLERALADCRIRWSGSFMQLEPHNGWPTVGGLAFSKAGTLTDVGRLARGWWGVGLACVSDVLLDGLGRCDAVEVYFSVFSAPEGGLSVIYLESATATDYRIKAPEAAENLLALQLAMCDAGHFEISIYDEQNHNRNPIPTRRELEVSISRAGADPRRGDLSVVASCRQMSLERARQLAGSRADEVKLSTSGYVMFPFLSPGG